MHASIGSAYNKSPLHDRLLSNIRISDDSQCWSWKSPLVQGRAKIKYRYKSLFAYRVAYEYFVGAIPDGLTLDHLCENKGCVNPFHLEPVTQGENVSRHFENRRYERGVGVGGRCLHGHVLDKSNLAVYSGQIRCKKCNVENALRWRRNKNSIDIA